MVERERDEGEAARAVRDGPLQQEGVLEKAEGEKDEKGVDEGGDERVEEKQENQKEWSEIRLAIEELSPGKLKHGGAKPAAASPPPTLPFLGLSHLLLRVLDKIGPTMAVLRLDVQRNIERLQELYLLDPCKYSTLMDIVEKEGRDGTSRKVDSCSRAVLWLTRSMDFTIALLQRLGKGSDQQSLAQHVEAAYNVTLKPWHGWISSAAYKIAKKLIPETEAFTGFLTGTDQDSAVLKDEIEKLALLLEPLLDDIHSMMAKFKLDRLKST